MRLVCLGGRAAACQQWIIILTICLTLVGRPLLPASSPSWFIGRLLTGNQCQLSMANTRVAQLLDCGGIWGSGGVTVYNNMERHGFSYYDAAHIRKPHPLRPDLGC
jgi:hypothetical protein